MTESVGDIPAAVREDLISRLEAAPVSLAVLFGSYAMGNVTSGSDIDIAVEYTDDLVDETDIHLSLVTDIAQVLGRDDVDVVRLTAVDPRIAVEALEHGELLVGTPAEASSLREQLEPASEEREAAVQRRIEEAERRIERRIEHREHG